MTSIGSMFFLVSLLTLRLTSTSLSTSRLVFYGLDFKTFFYPPYAAPVFDSNRDVVKWTVPDFSTDNLMTMPEGASHFRLILAVSVLSDFVYDPALGAYEKTNPDESKVNTLALSTEIPLGGMVGNDTIMTADLGIGTQLPTSVGVVAAIGVVFYQALNGVFYEPTSNNSMKVAVIG